MGKRRRFTVVCDPCKARKVRCDLHHPCSSCIKHKIQLLCTYDERPSDVLAVDSREKRKIAVTRSKQPVSASQASLPIVSSESAVYLVPSTAASVLARFSVLLDIAGVNPILNPKEILDFYAGYSSVSYDPVLEDETNHGPFSWHAVVRVDPGLTALWSFVLHNRPVAALDRLTSVYTKSVPSLNEGKQLLVLDRIRHHLLRKFDSKDLHFVNVPMGLTFRDPNSRKRDVAHEDRLLGILPPKAVVEYHINHFFSTLYPFFPFLDETLFRSSKERLFGLLSHNGEETGDSRFTYINSTAAMDSSYLGLLCIVLRLSYLSFISNDPKSAGEFQSSEMLKWPIGLEYVDYARTCISRLQILNCSNLAVLQLMVFMRIYIELSPEDIEGPGRDMFQVNNGVLLQMSYAIGLNREPTKAANALQDPRIHNVRRKLWVFIQFKDIVNSIKFGSPSISVPFSSDVRYPFLDDRNHNCLTPGNDELVIPFFSHLELLMPLMRQALSKVLNMSAPPIVDLVLAMNDLEAFVHTSFPSLKLLLQVYNEDSVHSRVLVLVLQLYIPVQVFLISIYFRLFLYYEVSEPSLALFYCKKLIAIMVLDYLPYIPSLLKDPHPFFGHAAQFVMNPHLEYFMHRLVGFLASWIIRLGYQITLDTEATTPTSTPATIAKLKFLMRSLSRGAKSCLMGIHSISHRYCYAWRISTTFTYIERILLAKEFYRHTLRQTAHVVPRVKYTDDQVIDLITLLEPLSSSTDLVNFERQWNLVQDVIQLGKGSAEAVKIFNPAESPLVVEGAPHTLADLISGSYSKVEQELALDTPLMPVDAQAMHSAMGAFFEGPEFYFDAFNGYNSGVSNSGLFDGFGLHGV